MELNKQKWTKDDENDFYEYFLSLKTPKNIDFDTKIANSKKQVLGIRVQVLRSIAKEIVKGDILSFLDSISLDFYEFYSLKGLLIAKIKDANVCIKYLKAFVPYIDNWATCDLMCGDLKIVSKHREIFYREICKMLKSKHVFEVRVAVVLLMKYYLSEQDINKTIDLIKNIKSDEYYINMAISWLLAEAYIKHKEIVIELLKSGNLNKFVTNKSISKICDSYRVDKLEKEELKKYRV